jgi:hypothetical protein
MPLMRLGVINPMARVGWAFFGRQLPRRLESFSEASLEERRRHVDHGFQFVSAAINHLASHVENDRQTDGDHAFGLSYPRWPKAIPKKSELRIVQQR